MWFKALKTRGVAELGASLADQFVTATSGSDKRKPTQVNRHGRELQTFLAHVDRDARPLRLGMFRRAKLANSFKWRLLDNGVARELVDELTQILLLRLTEDPAATATPAPVPAGRPNFNQVQTLLAQADTCAARSAHDEAARCYQDVLAIKPQHLVAHNNLGVALCHLGRYREAEAQFRRAIGLQSRYAEAYFNLGTVLRNLGRIVESELPLRRALKLKPRHVDAQVSLGLTLVLVGRLRDARDCFDKVLRVAPRHAGASFGLGQVASLEGHFDEAEALFKGALESAAQMPAAWAALAGLRRMTAADAPWRKSAERIAASGIAPLEEADLRFAIGKYCDDTGDFEAAFQSFKHANELQRSAAESYDRKGRTSFVDEMIRIYPRESFSAAEDGCSDSMKPVFVLGMMRSGTSLVEQIISSHPAARGAGELPFWNDAVRKYEAVIRNRWLAPKIRKKLAESYLNILAGYSPDALRVVDKATFNADHLGLIHAVFPKARLIYVRRDPLDACLSCYFHQLSTAHNFALDLADLAHYYREHRRLMEHWQRVLPAGSLLEVPYEELVCDQETWIRRIVAFLGLEWDEHCLNFYRTERPVLTASFWQVRQKMYRSSVGRWRNYEKFLGPLRELRDLR